ncbi:MAG: hypothetical protein A3E82_01810 [Gammaproteobacteria bacterium RIFCSPHIGHO2_12_FULL_38_11]|nr:MAG: hypothetical protein A3E82_01810 [Gammaproteobacteria bacterium RIFCSPHIGHO2_12_FULL_38_11]
MRKKTTCKKNRTLKVNDVPDITCTSPWSLTEVKALENYMLEVTFIDKTHGFVDMKTLIHSKDAGVFSVLKDVELFNQVYLLYGAVTWPGEIDLAPDAMHDEIKAHGIWVLS